MLRTNFKPIQPIFKLSNDIHIFNPYIFSRSCPETVYPFVERYRGGPALLDIDTVVVTIAPVRFVPAKAGSGEKDLQEQGPFLQKLYVSQASRAAKQLHSAPVAFGTPRIGRSPSQPQRQGPSLG